MKANIIKAPTRFGLLLYPGFAPLDVFGPIQALTSLSYAYGDLNLTIISETLDPVYPGPPAVGVKTFWPVVINSTVSEGILPTHTFETAPPIDVLMIPGGFGGWAPAPILDSTYAFIKERYPTLQYLFTVCTGSALVARTGVLDGKHATTNKNAWDIVTPWGPKVKWVAQARWVTDGNIWTTSGVAAGIDGFLAWIEAVYPPEAATNVANGMEYVRNSNSTNDPFAALNGLTDANNSTNPSPKYALIVI
ncbi:DJ-1/PfpI family protein [Hyaloscypha variabilis F]|uniref:DJ-1/PfpI family protein n=1 Tax=Hyaloscypha variabilis (strain UAMH 11265 / GT02V1 / F) TaxID=1149755 RepID=A0A2J6QWM1_HYAVF|nr:DJ-1/PfpI family protein [Hyaloscypha variabilis F]